MHGRLKIKTTEEQQLIKKKEQEVKLSAYQKGIKLIFEARKVKSRNDDILNLCSKLLTQQPDIYTLWNYRKEIVLLEIESSKTNEVDDKLELLNEFLDNELKVTQQCLLANPKSYSSWHHRYWILQHHPEANWQKEFDLCAQYLKMDARNFHCWDYRRLILNKVGIPLAIEIKFSTDHINLNFSNYSSWHYRSTLDIFSEHSVQEELSLVQNALFTDPYDTSAWFYLRWLLSNSIVTKEHKIELLESLNQLLELEPECRWILVAKCWLTEMLHVGDTYERKKCYETLEKLDGMRKGFYNNFKESIESDLGGTK